MDPYYLNYAGRKSGYKPKLIVPARKINDSMAQYVVGKTLKCLSNRNFNIKNSKILILGFAYKENCSDTRNTPVFEIYKKFDKKSEDCKYYRS